LTSWAASPNQWGVIPGEGEILIQLRPKEGTSFNMSELTACLDYTVARTADGADGDPER